MDIFMLFSQSFTRVWFFWKSRLQHKFTWWLQVLWKFRILLKFSEFLEIFEILKFHENFEFFWNFWKISEFSLIDDAVRVFRINLKLLCNLVAELKFRGNDSHCRSMVLKTMDCSIVKQLEKEKYSNFNVENFVVMFIYWGPIINVIPRFWLGIKYYSLMFSWQVEFWVAKQVLLTFQGSRAVTENQ
jgi:hypothetical protein